MDTKIEIFWDGTAPGLQEHRLSIGAFAKSLEAFLGAYRRIASGLVKNALDDPGYGASGGKFAKQAEALDLQIEAIKEGSLGVSVACTTSMPPETEDMFGGLQLRAAEHLLECVDGEANGRAMHAGARKFLRLLPRGVERHRYQASRNGKVTKTVEFVAVGVPDLPEDAPYLEIVRGSVVGVGFEPGRTEVRVKAVEPSRVVGLAATEAQVQKAIALRGVELDVMAVLGDKPRLLWMRPAGAHPGVPSRDARDGLIFGRWDDLLRRLAQ